MKLNRENFKKSVTKDDRTMYEYTCNDQNFYLVQGYVNGKRSIKVWSGSEDMLLDEEVGFTFDNTLESWAKYEELLEVCAAKQSSSGGFKNNPQENPNILPLLAIGDVKSNNKRDVTFFVQLDDKSQTSVFTFEVESNLMPSNLSKDNAFVVDWTSVEAPMLFKSEIIMKAYDEIKFEEEPDKLVFLFIPKSIVNQGGEQGGNTEGGEEGGEPKEGGDEGGEPTNKDGKPKDGGQSSDEEPKNEQSNGKQNDIRVDFGDTIMRISQITGEPPSVVSRFFSKKNSAKTFLQTNKFNEIKDALGLPKELNSNQVSEIIINSK
jgi:hypothetical protein